MTKKSAPLGLEAAKATGWAPRGRASRVSTSLLRGAESATSSGMWEPAVPAGLWAAPGEGKAASSAPASSHLVNTINNVISAPRTSLWRAGREFTELQLGTGLETPKLAPKANPALGARGWRGQSQPPAPPAALRAPFTLIPCASCSQAQQKFMMDTTAA